MALALLLPFAIPAALALCAALFRKERARRIPLFFVFSLAAVIAASLVQALAQPLFLQLASFSGGMRARLLHSFVQAALIEEACKTAFFLLALKRLLSRNLEFSDSLEFLALYFAAFSGSVFASFETLSIALYRPAAVAPRMLTAHILHPAALLISASGLFLWKAPSGIFIAVALSVFAHGLYNLIAGQAPFFAAAICASLALIAAAALWARVFMRARSSSGKGSSSMRLLKGKG